MRITACSTLSSEWKPMQSTPSYELDGRRWNIISFLPFNFVWTLLRVFVIDKYRKST